MVSQYDSQHLAAVWSLKRTQHQKLPRRTPLAPEVVREVQMSGMQSRVLPLSLELHFAAYPLSLEALDVGCRHLNDPFKLRFGRVCETRIQKSGL